MSFSKIIKWLVGLVVFLVIWSTSCSSNWSATSPEIQPAEFEYMQIKDGVVQASDPESSKMAMNCYGFEGQCRFDALNLRLSLAFEGLKISKPFYNLGFWGSNSGWQIRKYYFGFRILTVSTLDGKQLGVFKQTLWNTSAYSDFSQILSFDLGKHQVRISARDGFLAARELGYMVQY
jgi:hypothetical protein